MGRQLKTDEPLDFRVTLKLTKHQAKVLDKMVETDPSHETRQDLIRDLIKAAYVERMNRPKMDRLRMDVVPRDEDDVAAVDGAVDAHTHTAEERP
jgi:Arc/MetJ-type ribon-helix-helix transcriptional regulator